jgi:predicted acetyltransferase
MNSDAIFEYKWFDNYFIDSDRIAYFIKELNTNKLLGFVMVNSYMQKFDNGHSVAEFMIIPKYRRNKIGKRVAFEVFDLFKGNWEVQPSYQSEKAYKFWQKTIAEYTNDNYELKHEIFMFTN